MNRIHRGLLLKALGFKGEKIPTDFEGTFSNIECRSKWPEGIVCIADVVVMRSQRSDGRKTSAHRVYIVCPKCDRCISAGRMHQHLNTGGCKQ